MHLSRMVAVVSLRMCSSPGMLRLPEHLRWLSSCYGLAVKKCDAVLHDRRELGRIWEASEGAYLWAGREGCEPFLSLYESKDILPGGL